MRLQKDLQRGTLVVNDYGMDRAVHNFSPRAPFWRWRTPIVKAYDDVTGLSDGAIVIVVPRAPLVQHRLRRRFSVHVNENGIFLRGVKMRRLQHPGVERGAF